MNKYIWIIFMVTTAGNLQFEYFDKQKNKLKLNRIVIFINLAKNFKRIKYSTFYNI